ncbi:MAG: GAF domain-containing protein [Acholeplasmatales bacterium]|nr:GAF domain-containing protein [Acholeplasmatales bacterium]
MNKKEKYIELVETLPFLLENVEYDISILSNVSAVLNDSLENINWVGFYINKNNELLLGPFQGHMACTRIPFNKGVCGHCATTNKTIIVDNVHEFDGHIACDSASNSEICVPININGTFYGLLDIDSPLFNNFDETDKIYLEKIVEIIQKSIKFN